MTTIYRITVPADGLALIDGFGAGWNGERQLWVMGNTPQRKHKPCVICGKDLRGVLSYRPMGNTGNRYERICQRCIDQNKIS